MPPLKLTSIRNLNNLPVILSASLLVNCRCPVMDSSLGNEAVSESVSCMTDSYMLSFVDCAMACARESLKRCERDLNVNMSL